LSNNIKEKLSFCPKIKLLLSTLFPFEKERMKVMGFICDRCWWQWVKFSVMEVEDNVKKYSGGRL
jgi:hypothetical protein